MLHMVGGGYGIYNTAQADVETAVPRTLQLLEVEVDQIMKVCPLLPQAGCTCGAPGGSMASLGARGRLVFRQPVFSAPVYVFGWTCKGCEADRPVARCMCVCV